jgi:hypothetical protein
VIDPRLPERVLECGQADISCRDPHHEQGMIGQTISHYEVLEKLGEGGMSLYEAVGQNSLRVFPASKRNFEDPTKRSAVGGVT